MKDKTTYIGNYEITGVLGTGGMAKVYTAKHTSGTRRVVIKEMAHPESKQRFKQEAIISKALKHKNIVATHDYFTIRSSHYLVMEYVDGTDLATLIHEQSPLAPRTAALITHEVCCAIGYAHKRNIIHRDIKPTNILLSQRGNVKLSDFGVARGEDLPHLTQTGTLIGTPFYMSPEQASGDTVTCQTDIYSLGIVLYEMTTGQRPFTGINAQTITARVCRGRYASPFWRMPQHSLRLSRIIEKAMQKNVRRRYQTAEALCKDLERFVGRRMLARKHTVIANQVQHITKSRRATTIVKPRHTTKKKKKKKRTKHNVLLVVGLITVLVILILYLLRLLLS
jgi:serine/threonine-protein kinase